MASSIPYVKLGGASPNSTATSNIVRTSTGSIYVLIGAAGTSVQMAASFDNGRTWSIQDITEGPKSFRPTSSLAIDGNDVIHVVGDFSPSTDTPVHATFNTVTNTWSSLEAIPNFSGGQIIWISVAIDSNNVPHMAWGINGSNIQYSNRLGGFWKNAINIVTTVNGFGAIQIDQTNSPQIVSTRGTGILAALGNKNNATSFTTNTIASSTVSNTSTNVGLAIDSSNNTWVTYGSATNGPIVLAQHIQNQPWSTWQPIVTDNNPGLSPMVTVIGNTVYIVYRRVGSGIAYDAYNSITERWLGEQIVQANTSVMATATNNTNPNIKTSTYFNNGAMGLNNQGSNTIDYIFTQSKLGTNYLMYDKIRTAQIATGCASISFSGQQPTTTSTSTSVSTSSSTSVSSTSSSTSQSTSTSSTSSSTSQSTSTSQSSTSSSTSQSVSTSTSQSSTSSSTSHSTSTSISSPSVSTSTSQSSTSSSTSLSTSTSISSTSSSTSTTQSFTTSTSSTSSSTSTTISTSTSFTTSSTSSSTSISFSTSSTSSSTSTSQSSTSSSTSHSTSTSQSSTSSSSSTSTSTTISTSTSTSMSSTSTSTTTLPLPDNGFKPWVMIYPGGVGWLWRCWCWTWKLRW